MTDALAGRSSSCKVVVNAANGNLTVTIRLIADANCAKGELTSTSAYENFEIVEEEEIFWEIVNDEEHDGSVAPRSCVEACLVAPTADIDGGVLPCAGSCAFAPESSVDALPPYARDEVAHTDYIVGGVLPVVQSCAFAPESSVDASPLSARDEGALSDYVVGGVLPEVRSCAFAPDFSVDALPSFDRDEDAFYDCKSEDATIEVAPDLDRKVTDEPKLVEVAIAPDSSVEASSQTDTVYCYTLEEFEKALAGAVVLSTGTSIPAH